MRKTPGQNKVNKEDCYYSSHPWVKVKGTDKKAGEYLKEKAAKRYSKIVKLSHERTEARRIRREERLAKRKANA